MGRREQKGVGFEEIGGDRVGDDREHFRDGWGTGSGEIQGSVVEFKVLLAEKVVLSIIISSGRAFTFPVDMLGPGT